MMINMNWTQGGWVRCMSGLRERPVYQAICLLSKSAKL